MSSLLSPSNKDKIVNYKKSTNNGNSDRDSGSNSGGDSEDVNESYGAKMICIQDKLGK